MMNAPPELTALKPEVPGTPGTPGAAQAPVAPVAQAPAAPAAPEAVRPKPALKGTMIGVAPPSGGVKPPDYLAAHQAAPPPAATAPSTPPAASPPQPSKPLVNPMGRTMLGIPAPGGQEIGAAVAAVNAAATQAESSVDATQPTPAIAAAAAEVHAVANTPAAPEVAASNVAASNVAAPASAIPDTTPQAAPPAQSAPPGQSIPGQRRDSLDGQKLGSALGDASFDSTHGSPAFAPRGKKLSASDKFLMLITCGLYSLVRRK